MPFTSDAAPPDVRDRFSGHCLTVWVDTWNDVFERHGDERRAWATAEMAGTACVEAARRKSLSEAELVRYEFITAKYRPDQARVPGGDPEGGQFAADEAARATIAATFASAPDYGATDEERRAIWAYQASFEAVNRIQENPDSDEANAFAAAVAKCPPASGMLYRGIDMHGGLTDHPDEIQALWTKRIGKTIAFHEPVSTSTDARTAMQYGEVLFHINAAPGAARDISGLSHFKSYPEAILATGRYVVDAVMEGPPITHTTFGPISARRSTVVMIRDVTKGPRKWTSDVPKRGKATAAGVPGGVPGGLRRFIAVEGETGGFEVLDQPQLDPEAEALILSGGKADSEDDHYYGAWSGGSRRSGGHAAVGSGSSTSGSAVDRAIRKYEDEIYTLRNSEERSICLDAQGKVILDKGGTGYSVFYSKAELASLAGGVFTHNHPRGWDVPNWDPRRVGNSFSLPDMDVAITAKLAELRAVTPTTRFTLKPAAGKGWGVTPEELAARWHDVDSGVRREFQARIDAADSSWGATREERQAHAESEHTQLLNARLAKQFGWQYLETPR